MIYTINATPDTSLSSEGSFTQKRGGQIIDVFVERRQCFEDRRSVLVSKISENTELKILKEFDTRSSAGRRKSDINKFKRLSVKA